MRFYRTITGLENDIAMFARALQSFKNVLFLDKCVLTIIFFFLARGRQVVWTEAATINTHSTKHPREIPRWRTNFKGIQ